jgi:predicted nucleic acid binding AN1-type Zn finger protein
MSNSDIKPVDNKPVDNKPVDKHCNICRKYSSFLLECKCKNKYCSSHILPEIHKCLKLDEFRQEAFNKNKESLLKNAIGPKPQIIAL